MNMKLIFGDPESIKIRDEYIKEWYLKNIESDAVIEICEDMENETKECDCYFYNTFREQFCEFEVNLSMVQEKTGRLIWMIKCSLSDICMHERSWNCMCDCTEEVITDLVGNLIED